MSIKVALDHDGTYTAFPTIWNAFIDAVRSSGGEVFCITSRFPNVPIHGFPGTVYYTCGQMKAEWAHEHGIKVDIWIDDMPSCIGAPPGMIIEPGQAPQRLADHQTDIRSDSIRPGTAGKITRQQALDWAVRRYWDAGNGADQRCAYYAILFLGGRDGYPPCAWRAFLALCLRRMALVVEGEWRFLPEPQHIVNEGSAPSVPDARD